VVLYYDQYDYLNVDGLTITGWDYIGALPDQTWQIAGTGDFNNDGKPDIIWSNIMPGDAYSKLNVVMYMDGVTVKGFDLMSSIANVLPLFSDQNWRIVATGDFNNDGKSDIVWRNISKTDLYAGMNAIIYMDGIKLIKYDFLPSVSDQNWMIEGAGDFNEDVYTDILWRNTKTGQNMVWYMNGKTQLGTAMLETLSDTNWTIVSE